MHQATTTKVSVGSPFLSSRNGGFHLCDNAGGRSLFVQLVISPLPVPPTTTVILLLNQCARLLPPLLPAAG